MRLTGVVVGVGAAAVVPLGLGLVVGHLPLPWPLSVTVCLLIGMSWGAMVAEWQGRQLGWAHVRYRDVVRGVLLWAISYPFQVLRRLRGR